MAPHLPLSLIFVFVAIFQIPWSTCDIMINGMPIPENEDLLRIMKEELDIFQVDITKSFMETHSRRKRGEVLHPGISENHKFICFWLS